MSIMKFPIVDWRISNYLKLVGLKQPPFYYSLSRIREEFSWGVLLVLMKARSDVA